MFQWNASKFAILLEYENPCIFILFCTTYVLLYFFLMNALVYVNCQHIPGHSLWKKSSTKWTTKKTTWVFVFQKYGKFWSVSLEHLVEHKPLISEVWQPIIPNSCIVYSSIHVLKSIVSNFVVYRCAFDWNVRQCAMS